MHCNVAVSHKGLKSIPPYLKASDNLVLKSDSEMDFHRLPDVGERFFLLLFFFLLRIEVSVACQQTIDSSLV